MFQENERMEYSNRKAPDELKNRTWSSIQQEKRMIAKKRKQSLYIAACFVGILFMCNVMLQNSTIVKVNDRPISYLNVHVENEAGDIPFSISEGRNKEIHGDIPMEIHVSGKAHIAVSKGSIRIQNNTEVSENVATELDIQGKTNIVWSIEGVDNTMATCTITTEDRMFQYVVKADTSGWKMRLKEILQ